MKVGFETEVKFDASPRTLATLRALNCLRGPERTDTLITTYFDTPTSVLRRSGASLRIRAGSYCREQTFKLPSTDRAGVGRSEWTVSLDRDHPDQARFPTKARGALKGLLHGTPLVPIGLTRIERTSRQVKHGRSIIEAVFDMGTVEAGESSQRVHEFELELKDGCLVCRQRPWHRFEVVI